MSYRFRSEWDRFTLAKVTALGGFHWDPFNVEDPGNRFVDAGGAISGGLVSGTATTDPGDACGWSIPARDIFEGSLTGALLFQLFTMLREITPPAPFDDTFVFLGLGNESSPNSGTADGFGISFRYPAAGTRVAGIITILNGVATLSNDAAPAGLLRRLFLSVTRFGTSAGSWYRIVGTGLTDAGGFIGGPWDTIDGGTSMDIGTGPYWWWLAFGRLAVGVGNVSIAHSAFTFASPPPRQGFVPT